MKWSAKDVERFKKSHASHRNLKIVSVKGNMLVYSFTGTLADPDSDHMFTMRAKLTRGGESLRWKLEDPDDNSDLFETDPLHDLL